MVAVTSGWWHSCALTSAGAIKCWGTNDWGVLGNGTTTNSTVPVDVTGLGSGTTAISAGLMQSCSVTTAGAVKCWGNNVYGQLGDGTTTNPSVPVSVIGLG